MEMVCLCLCLCCLCCLSFDWTGLGSTRLGATGNASSTQRRLDKTRCKRAKRKEPNQWRLIEETGSHLPTKRTENREWRWRMDQGFPSSPLLAATVAFPLTGSGPRRDKVGISRPRLCLFDFSTSLSPAARFFPRRVKGSKACRGGAVAIVSRWKALLDRRIQRHSHQASSLKPQPWRCLSMEQRSLDAGAHSVHLQAPSSNLPVRDQPFSLRRRHSEYDTDRSRKRPMRPRQLEHLGHGTATLPRRHAMMPTVRPAAPALAAAR